MGKNALIFLLAAATAGLAAWTLVQQRALREMREAAAFARTAPSGVARPTEPAIAADRPAGTPPGGVAREPLPQPPPLPPPSAMDIASSVPAPLAVFPSGETNAAPEEGFVKMMKSAGMKEMIRAQQSATLDGTYGTLFRYLQLPEENLAAFKQLLVDKQMAVLDLSLDVMDPSASPEQRSERSRDIQKVNAQYDEQIKAVLGETNYGVFKEYEQTQPERMQVSLFKQSLPATDPLTEEQEHNLIRVLYEERTNYVFSAKFDDPRNADAATLTDETIARHMEELGGLQAKTAARAGTILTPAQLQQFQESQKQQRAMQEMGMKMAGRLFGRAPAKPVVGNAASNAPAR